MCFISLSPNKYIGFMGPPHEVSIYRICTKAFNKCPCWYRVKSGNFRYQVKSDSDLICFIWISTACKYMSKFTWSPNLHDFTLISEDRVLNCGRSLHLYQYFVYASSAGYDESAHMHILAWVSVARECDNYQHFMVWQNILPSFGENAGTSWILHIMHGMNQCVLIANDVTQTILTLLITDDWLWSNCNLHFWSSPLMNL